VNRHQNLHSTLSITITVIVTAFPVMMMTVIIIVIRTIASNTNDTQLECEALVDVPHTVQKKIKRETKSSVARQKKNQTRLHKQQLTIILSTRQQSAGSKSQNNVLEAQ